MTHSRHQAKKQTNQQGFTLIEVMIVVAIIAILVALSLATYAFYGTRARLAEAMLFASTAKLYVVENAYNGVSPAAGWITPSGTDNLRSVTIAEDGTITVTTSARAGDGTVLFIPDPRIAPGVVITGRIAWSCTPGTIAPLYLPRNCRQ